jgi:enediyne biosynthesis protein E4
VSARAGTVFQVLSTGRGAAFGDIDNDGDTDVVVASNNGPVQLLMNQIGQRHHWIGLRLVGEVVGANAKASARRPVRDMLGARVAVTSGGRTLWRRARSDGSYASANDPRVLVGLGSSTSVSEVRVIWPDGRTETFRGLPIDRYTTVKEGSGR